MKIKQKRAGKTGFIIVLAILLLIIAGCQGGFGFGKKVQPQTNTAFVGGTKGLEIAFAQDQPPSSVLDNGQQEFSVTLLLRNLGEYTIPVGGVIGSLSGVVQSSFGMKSLDVTNKVDVYGTAKEGENSIPGGEEQLEFGTAVFKPDLPANTKFTLKVDVCYNYQTKAVSTICLKKSVLQKETGEGCMISNPAVGQENSGAPMQIEQMKESSVGTSKVRINFKVVNKGIGAVYEPGTFNGKCAGMESEKNRVKVTVESADNTFAASCTQLGNGNSGVVTLVNNQKDMTCTIDTGNMQDITFQDLVIVKLDYQYREAVMIPLIVTNAA